MKKKPEDVLQVPHDFKLVPSKSYKKGSMMRSKNGIYQIMNENKFTYHCDRCDSECEFDQKVNIRQLNVHVAVRYSCRPVN